ncbi:S8 family serine peptidase [Alteromonas sp. CYL-A6]|uniref:S8 family serine peptidase n=1 Tax=Alteromonas nitratireducens TaxID=3390813 RepID=UPI0034B0091E
MSQASLNSQDIISQANLGLDKLEAAIEALGVDVKIKSRTTKLAAALVLEAGSSAIDKIKKLDAVDAVLPVYDSKLHIADSAEYIKATSLVADGVASGDGIRVAILDSGLDYTHAAVGGPGTAEAYAEATSNLADTPEWPIGNVLGGYDFFNGDPDPMDNNNHGTHVTHSVLGVAPDAGIYAYTVCDRFCPGAAQLAGLEAAMDPNGDGDISDRVDVINMSLGGDYGTSRGGAVADLINRAVDLGVVVAISAGNDGAYPFIVGGPSTTDNALSVGAMTHPVTPASAIIANVNGSGVKARAAAFNPDDEFSVDDSVPMVYVEPTDPEVPYNLGCTPFSEDLTGTAVLIFRGSCGFTTKVQNAQAAGAEFVVVANNIPGAYPITMGGTPTEEVTINSVMVSYEAGVTVKDALAGGAVTYAFEATSIAQPGAIASFTSRGPSLDGRLKPEITAPGVAIDTAEVGTGDGTSPISGTSFSSPITAGAMSILAEIFPRRNAHELKATIMNTANLNVTLESTSVNEDAELAPISYIGAGLVDVEKASMSQVAAWDADTKQAALSFGALPLADTASVTKTITVKNFSTEEKTYTLSDEARFSDDAESGAVTMDYPETITVPAGQTITFEVTATVDPTLLPEWSLTSSNMFIESNVLSEVEYDGALFFTEDGNDEPSMHLVYHAIPKGFAKATVSSEITEDGVVRMVTNTGVVPMETFTAPLTMDSGIDEDEMLDVVSVSLESYPTGDCSSGSLLFATITMRDPLMLTHQAGFFMDVDVDSDGSFDFTTQAINGSLLGFSGYSPVTWTRTFGAIDFNGVFYPTLHEAGSNQLTMITCTNELGLTAADIGNVAATVAVRVEESEVDLYPTGEYEEALVGVHDFAYTTSLPYVVDADGEVVDSLAPGESGYLMNVGNGGFTFVSGGGVMPTAVPTDSNSAPTIEAQSFEVDENAEDGTVIGTIVATDADGITSPVSEFFVQSSTSIAVDVSRDGVITVANSELLDFDAGMESIMMEVVAIDTMGNTSDAAQIDITINNLADEPSEQPQPDPVTPPASNNGGGGSTGWLALLLLPVALLRRIKR